MPFKNYLAKLFVSIDKIVRAQIKTMFSRNLEFGFVVSKGMLSAYVEFWLEFKNKRGLHSLEPIICLK